MRRLVLVAGLAAAALIPTFAFAQSSCEQQRDNHVVGTVAGVGIGALLGSAIAPRGDRGTGAVIGAIGGGVIGNQVTRPDRDCAHAYGYYDHANQWHNNLTGAGLAQGYYDHDGQWVEGAPNGYYDQGNRWVASSASGYYDTDGHWVSGPASGAYDARGRWMPGAANGHRDSSGMWVMDAAPGYYDGAGHWRSGAVRGRYNQRGVWVSAANAGDYVTDASYPAHRELQVREAWLEQRIRTATRNGDLSHRDGRRAMMQLNGLRHSEAGLRDVTGRLSRRDEAMLQSRLDRLGASLQLSEADARAAF